LKRLKPTAGGAGNSRATGNLKQIQTKNAKHIKTRCLRQGNSIKTYENRDWVMALKERHLLKLTVIKTSKNLGRNVSAKKKHEIAVTNCNKWFQCWILCVFAYFYG